MFPLPICPQTEDSADATSSFLGPAWSVAAGIMAVSIKFPFYWIPLETGTALGFQV